MIELDGPHHGRAPDRRDDARRDERLRAAGWDVRRVAAPQDVIAVARERLAR
ncbi:DUF559 domain-containing protein [Solirubrobacter sp. CPCC 204708]|uniref:DUF559 domain-containing protein n=1 Tax=Solirubrobacter deserti TaxID=2282478 RepID=A0ABT4RSZ6_9ACTN|nr:DUF559 domain-containing protein [Solirubrobacter deserti]MBE2320353.1 DUF559 domain-containing protein [Solirubrobacter deserti]MDA0141705.1 DUF559 domain-containing protein [Solirubrobacter deserti]